MTRDTAEANPMFAEDPVARLTTLHKRIDVIEHRLEELRGEYRDAGNDLPTIVADDVSQIREAYLEVRRITTFLQGTELFGRYAQDADRHCRIANSWRAIAVGTLLATPPVAVALSIWLAVPSGAVWVAISPLLLLFLYASVESLNHRRREFDRRRIALRVSAIEAFTRQRRESYDDDGRRKAEKLLDLFIRKHFIYPELDSNEMVYVRPRVGLFTTSDRRRAQPDKARPRDERPARREQA